MKAGLIVEGDSDKEFFEKYFKPNFKRNILVISPGKKGLCKIQNKQKIHKEIKVLFAKGCDKVYILVDLDTQCIDGKNFECILELKKWYKNKISLDKFQNINIVIVSKEIESWMLSAWENSDTKSKKDLQKLFELKTNSKKTINEKELVERFKNSKKHINRTKNKSLDYFFTKLGL